MNRRDLFKQLGCGLLGATMLSGCVMTKEGTKVTALINTARMDAYMQAGLNAAETIGKIIVYIPILATYSPMLDVAVKGLTTLKASFAQAVGDQITVSYDSASIKTMVDSALTIIEDIGDIIKKVLSDIVSAHFDSDLVSKIEITYSSLKTIISLLKALILPAFANTPATNLRQFANVEASALRVLGVEYV